MKFSESGLVFQFSNNWIIKKYDSHTYYQGLKGVGLKAVDFIGIWQKESLLLMEVKNYRNHHGYLSSKDLQAVLDQPEQLVEVFQQKIDDTIKAMETIRAYYQRQFLYRLFLPLIHRMPPMLFDRVFWTKAEQLLHQPQKVQAVLWLELEERHHYFYQQIQERLSQAFSDHPIQASVAYRSNHPFGNSLIIKDSE